jgi:iron complex outermembrane receptor protein
MQRWCETGNVTLHRRRNRARRVRQHSILGVVGAGFLAGAAAGQQVPPSVTVLAPTATGTGSTDANDDIIVTGHRLIGSAVSEVEPIAVLDENAIRALRSTSFKDLLERLKPLTASADGTEPVYLLNGRRISGLSELDSLPPEAIERTEVLPESEAARFGFAPTVRVTNFITKKHFRALTLQEVGGTTTEGGGGSNYVELNSTRIDGPRRLSLSASHLRLFPLLQSQRAITPDPNALYALGGTITGVDGASIDPALDALAGRAVTLAPLPATSATRGSLGGYVAGANTAAISDTGAYRSLQQRSDTVNINATLASPIGKSLNGSLNLALETQRSDGLNGLAPVTLTVPASAGTLPFSSDVLLYRSVPDAVLRQHADSLNLHAGGTLQGGIHRWAWNVTGSYDRLTSSSRSDQGVDATSLQAAIDTGADPLTLPDAVSIANPLIDRSHTVTGTVATKAVANGPLFRLPAGDIQTTVSADYVRSDSSGNQLALAGQPFDFRRETKSATVAVNIPVAVPGKGVLPFLGRLSLDGMLGVSDVSDYGRLISSSFGGTWTPKGLVQFTATISDILTPPNITLLTNPVVATPNTPFFDSIRGTTSLVTVLTGGRSDLLPERRRRSQIGVALTPIKGKEFRIRLDYLDTHWTNRTATLGSATEAFQSAFPADFVRDDTGQLISADLRPVNIDSDRERQLRMAVNLTTPIGRSLPPPPASSASGDAKAGSSTKVAKARPTLSASVTTVIRLADQVTLQPGASTLDLLDGATLTGTGGKPRWETTIDVTAAAGAVSLGLYGRLQGATRLRSDVAQSDLRFSGRTWLVPYGSLDAAKVVNRPWARQLSLILTVENLLNDRVNVRDRTGATPNRFQAAYLDPLGRSIRLGIRKLF